ncbi:tapasin-related protein [Ctenodactylus gundi]
MARLQAEVLSESERGVGKEEEEPPGRPAGREGREGPAPSSSPGSAASVEGQGRGGARAAHMGPRDGWWLLLCLALSLAPWAVAGTERQATATPWQAVDVLLDCFLVTESGQAGALASNGDKEKALLVLKQVPVPEDSSLEGLTDFQGGTVAKDGPPVIFEASVDLVKIPQAEALLHADCSGKAVTCEISHYSLHTRPEATADTAARFIANAQVTRSGPSVSMVLKTVRGAENGAAWHPTLNLPLSPQGTMRTAVEFQVTTQSHSLSFPLGTSASLDCSFSMAPGLDLVSVEWRLQYKGHGQLVYSWTTGQGQAKRAGAALQPEPLLRAGDASLTLPSLTLKDEGAYICQITTTLYQAQQIIHLNIHAPPKVRLSMATDGYGARLPSLVCSITGYYPLDMEVKWVREEGGSAPAQVSGASFSSLRQSTEGTYSISSSLTADPGSAGATYTCQVTHVSLEKPLQISTQVVPRTEWKLADGVTLASCLLVTLLLLGLWRLQASSSRFAKTMRHME